jgi:hypothetical protein
MDVDKTDHPHGSLIDHERSACLCDAGAPDYLAAVCVNPDGQDVLWLVFKTELDAEHPRQGKANQLHEYTGRLPQVVRDRIWGDSLRCGRPRWDGKPCRQRVKEPGQPCSTHGGPGPAYSSICGRLRQDGRPCLQRVAEPGLACRRHGGQVRA